MKSKEEILSYNETRSLTGENVRLVRVKCQCGHTLTFLSHHPKTCSHCGRLHYASKKSEFKDKMMRKLKI